MLTIAQEIAWMPHPLFQYQRTIKILIAANCYLLKNLRDFGDIRFFENVETDTLLLVDGCIHFLRGAPWWVTWCLLRYHLFFTFFWQISHWSSLPTVCIFKMCWNGTLNESCPQRAVHAGTVVYLFEIEFVAEHPLTVLTHARLSRLPGGPQQSRHLIRAQQSGHLVSSTGPVHTLSTRNLDLTSHWGIL